MLNKNTSSPSSSIYILLSVVILVWGISWPIAKFGLAYIPPLWFATYRVGTAFIFMFCLLLSSGNLILPRAKDLPLLLIIGLVQIGLFMILITLGLSFAPAGHTAVLVYTTPIWAIPLAVIFFKEPFNKIKLVSLILGIIGIVVLFISRATGPSSSHLLIGSLFATAAAICWAIAMVCTRYWPWYSSPLQMAPWQLLIALIPMIIISLIAQPHPDIQWTHAAYGSVFFCGIFATAFAYYGIVTVSKELPVVTTSLALLSVPVASIIASHIILNEVITFNMIIAMTCILASLTLIALGNLYSRQSKSFD